MNLTKEHIKLIILSGISILLLIILIRKPVDKSGIEKSAALIKAKDEVIQAKQQFIEYLKEDNAWMDKHIQELKQRDSVLLARITANQPKYIANDKKYNDIPAAVNNLDKHQLRREFANY